jgi:hypothetical protein
MEANGAALAFESNDVAEARGTHTMGGGGGENGVNEEGEEEGEEDNADEDIEDVREKLSAAMAKIQELEFGKCMMQSDRYVCAVYYDTC